MKSSKQVLDEYANRLSEILMVPLEYVVRLREYGLFDNKAVRDLMIHHDFCVLIKSKKLSKQQIYIHLSEKYGVEIAKVRRVSLENKKRFYFCSSCGSPISKRKFLLNDGLCDRCLTSKRSIIN